MDIIDKLIGKSKWTVSASVIYIFVQGMFYIAATWFVDKDVFGLYAIASAPVFIILGLIENTTVNSLIHKEDCDSADYKAVFRINMWVAFAGGLVVLLFNTIYALGFGHKAMIPVVIALMPVLLISSITSVAITGMRKNLFFRHLSIAEIFANVMAVGSGIAAAILGYQLAALVLVVLTRYAAMLLFVLFSFPKFYSFETQTKKETIKEHFRFGRYIMGEKLLGTVLSYVDVLILGAFIGLAPLGVYDVFKKVIIRPVVHLYVSIEQVVFPLMTQAVLNNIFEKFYKSYLSRQNTLFFALFSFTFINADLLIWVFPSHYMDAQPLFRAVLFLALSIVILNPLDIVMYAHNATRAFFYWMTVNAVFMIIIMLISIQYGLLNFVCALSMFQILAYVVAYVFIIKGTTDIRWTSYFIPIGLPFIVFLPAFFMAPEPIELVGTLISRIISNLLLILLTWILWKRFSQTNFLES